MRHRLRWASVAIAGVVMVGGGISAAPRSLPAAPPPVRLEGAIVEMAPTQNELIVVPSPSIDLGDDESSVTTTTLLGDEVTIDDDLPDTVASADESEQEPAESRDSDDGSADSVDDD